MVDMAAFDYHAEAELFPGAARPHRGKPLGYRRFASVAEALRFAMEELPPASLAGAPAVDPAQRADRPAVHIVVAMQTLSQIWVRPCRWPPLGATTKSPQQTDRFNFS
jgi:hypothetical protein